MHTYLRGLICTDIASIAVASAATSSCPSMVRLGECNMRRLQSVQSDGFTNQRGYGHGGGVFWKLQAPKKFPIFCTIRLQYFIRREIWHILPSQTSRIHTSSRTQNHSISPAQIVATLADKMEVIYAILGTVVGLFMLMRVFASCTCPP
jgi:hypothetical protein